LERRIRERYQLPDDSGDTLTHFGVTRRRTDPNLRTRCPAAVFTTAPENAIAEGRPEPAASHARSRLSNDLLTWVKVATHSVR
jgi:hypothetical protein